MPVGTQVRFSHVLNHIVHAVDISFLRQEAVSIEMSPKCAYTHLCFKKTVSMSILFNLFAFERFATSIIHASVGLLRGHV